MKKRIGLMFIVIMLAVSLVSCRQADKVSHNISLEADNFKVVRRFTIINAVSDKPVFELIGAFSFQTHDNRIEITVEDENGNYKKHTIALTEFTIWNVEDLHAKNVNKYKYIVNFQPKAILPYKIETID